MRFSSWTTAFAHRVFPAHCELIHKPGYVRKMATPAIACNSWFTGGFPRLAGIFAGKTRKNSSDTPTSGSHISLVQTPIRANLISLEIRRHELSDDMLHDPFWAPEGLQNFPQKSGQKIVRAQKSRRIRKGGCMADKIATWQGARLARPHHAPRAMVAREVCNFAYK